MRLTDEQCKQVDVSHGIKVAGEWLKSRLSEDMSNFTQGFITLGELDALCEGRLPSNEEG